LPKSVAQIKDMACSIVEERKPYRGRLAPSPTGLLHIGHARTFWIATRRAAERNGTLILRNEDLDPQRCQSEFVDAMYEDLRWLGIEWAEGPDRGGPYGPYAQSERRALYSEGWVTLKERGMIYPCTCSRKDVAQAAGAPNEGDDERVYPGTCREKSPLKPRPGLNGAPEATREQGRSYLLPSSAPPGRAESPFPHKRIDPEAFGANWRFRVQDGEQICFTDLHLGRQVFVAGRDFGDFIVWRRDGIPAYQLAVVVDDATMHITEVVRGADLLKSTARQILLFRALGLAVPDYYHCDLVRDEAGIRLAKRHDALSIRKLRKMGWTPEKVRGPS
jgi:glutamyl/glutaminyl-tRNA synthetase